MCSTISPTSVAGYLPFESHPQLFVFFSVGQADTFYLRLLWVLGSSSVCWSSGNKYAIP